MTNLNELDSQRQVDLRAAAIIVRHEDGQLDVLRRPAADVEAEIAAAEEAQKAAKRQARTVLREQRLAKHKADIHAKIEELKAKRGRQRSTAGAGA